ncbi:MAG TPA: type IIL restriction-modification enzyme MmeI [Candidatus Angelobacter sp.]|nr:type IIL restriction-modification enzyme MmeI [Candidatus Angelobacter sp.]
MLTEHFNGRAKARGKAHVHVVIIGFGAFDAANKLLYDYDSVNPTVTSVRNISPYLIEGADIALPIRREALCSVPEIVNGNKPADGGFLIIEDEDKQDFLNENRTVGKYIRRFLSADEYLNNQKRWVMWLVDAPPSVIRENPGVRKRVESVREFRLQSRKESTRRRADRPALFDQIRQPKHEYILVPRHSSENRKYVPLGYFSPENIIADSCTAIPDASLFHFGVISSSMHMAWMRQVCGRLESRYRYSNKLVYNNFPWPESPTDKQRAAVESAAQAVLEARKWHPNSSLADLYDPLSMPPNLVKAHAQLDRAVELCYRPQPFDNDRQRVEYLFALYEKLTAPLIPLPPKRRRRAASR